MEAVTDWLRDGSGRTPRQKNVPAEGPGYVDVCDCHVIGNVMPRATLAKDGAQAFSILR